MPFRRFARRWKGNGEEAKRLSSLILYGSTPSRFPTFMRDETSDESAVRRGGSSQMKKRAGLYFPLTSERKRRSWRARSSTNCLRGDRARNQSTSCPTSALPLPRSFPAYRLLYSKLYQTSRDARMRSLCSGAKKLG